MTSLNWPTEGGSEESVADSGDDSMYCPTVVADLGNDPIELLMFTVFFENTLYMCISL